MDRHHTMTLDGQAYVLVPMEEYEAMQVAGAAPAGDAVAYARQTIARTLKAAREAAGLTQAELARRLRKSQPMVARAESGSVSVGERYVAAVLAACDLPEDWKPAARKPRKSKRNTGQRRGRPVKRASSSSRRK